MAKNKVFNVHDLYPKDYRFDYKAFEADPEGYPFTAEDQAYFNAMELEQYEANVPMTAHDVFCQVLFLKKSVGIPFFQQGIFLAFSGHHASLRMRACSIR